MKLAEFFGSFDDLYDAVINHREAWEACFLELQLPRSQVSAPAAELIHREGNLLFAGESRICMGFVLPDVVVMPPEATDTEYRRDDARDPEPAPERAREPRHIRSLDLAHAVHRDQDRHGRPDWQDVMHQLGRTHHEEGKYDEYPSRKVAEQNCLLIGKVSNPTPSERPRPPELQAPWSEPEKDDKGVHEEVERGHVRYILAQKSPHVLLDQKLFDKQAAIGKVSRYVPSADHEQHAQSAPKPPTPKARSEVGKHAVGDGSEDREEDARHRPFGEYSEPKEKSSQPAPLAAVAFRHFKGVPERHETPGECEDEWQIRHHHAADRSHEKTAAQHEGRSLPFGLAKAAARKAIHQPVEP